MPAGDVPVVSDPPASSLATPDPQTTPAGDVSALSTHRMARVPSIATGPGHIRARNTSMAGSSSAETK